MLNTLLVSAIGIFFATLLGFIIGIARLSRNFIISRLALIYVETLRNVPLLLQLVFWYFAVLKSLPGVRQSLVFFDSVILNQRGLYLPRLVTDDRFIWVCGGHCRRDRRHRRSSGAGRMPGSRRPASASRCSGPRSAS